MRAAYRQRFRAGIVFVVVAGIFLFLALAAAGRIDVELLFGPCGFKQDYDLPCPTCGITTSALAFVRGRIFESFYIQPAGGLFCGILLIAGFLAFLVSVFGVYFKILERFFNEVKIRYIILAIIIIVMAAWAVTLAREML